VRVTLASLVRGWLTTPAVVTTAELFETQRMVLPSVPKVGKVRFWVTLEDVSPEA
jgi:hypothetical protein